MATSEIKIVSLFKYTLLQLLTVEGSTSSTTRASDEGIGRVPINHTSDIPYPQERGSLDS